MIVDDIFLFVVDDVKDDDDDDGDDDDGQRWNAEKLRSRDHVITSTRLLRFIFHRPSDHEGRS
jgi:hypothetical protein